MNGRMRRGLAFILGLAALLLIALSSAFGSYLLFMGGLLCFILVVLVDLLFKRCPHCGKLKFVPFRCKSRFCPTCGNKYAMERTTSMSFKLVNVRHRHCVFTIDEQLRDFFLNDRSLLDCLFHAVNNVVSRMFFKQNKSMNFTPGFILVLHTFGRDLK